MRPLEEHTLQKLRDLDLLKSGDLVVVAVSGGSDSVALLHLLAAVVADLALRLCAVYVDHGLRPDETAAEAELVKKLALQLKVDFRTGTVPVREYGEERGLSVEAAARQLRYEFLERVAGELGAVAIAVAHTADDQAEEVLLRLIRGAGRNALAGMLELNYRRVIRPLLQVSKEQLLDYLREHDISFLEDSSNAERDFLRNRVRLDLLPYLQENFNPAIRQTLLRTADILGTEDELLGELARDLYSQAVNGPEDLDTIRADIKVILAGHPALRRRVVEQILVQMGGQPTFQHIENLLALAATGGNGNELHLAGGLRVVKRAGGLEFSYPAGRHPHRASLTASKDLSFEMIVDGPGNWPIKELGVTLLVEIEEQRPRRDELTGMAADYLDMAELAFPLTVRSVRPGDRFRPLGGPGSRKVADFLSDRKVARENRSRVPVLANQDGIVALPGLRIDHRYRLVPGTKKVLKITVLPI
ncbi:MAG: tRNA lysidine(34) synthetase TilS [Desulfobulbaceae bacterium]|nr:tRNA lysidine(34) synthetase TilS [Desulfobulbaceae bacterium]